MSNTKAPHTPLRVVFCTTPSVYSDAVLLELIRSPRITLVGIVHSTRILRKQGWALGDALQLIRKTGLRYAAYLWLVTSGYILLSSLRPNLVRKYLRQQAVPLHATRDINNSASVSFIQSCAPDLLLSAHFNQLIGPELLALPPQGGLNIHPGRLPDFRGVEPVLHALAAGERQLGVSVHRLDTQFDAGRVLAATDLVVQPDESLAMLSCRLFRAGAQLVLQQTAADGGLPDGTPQQSGGRYDSWPSPELVGRLRKNGLKLASLLDVLAMWRPDSL
jgi:methionyl-tRNA formyltransferase